MSRPATSRPRTIGEALTAALAHHHAGRLDEAARVCRAILAALPDQPDARHLLGLAQYRLGRLEDAERELARAVALRPQAAPYLANHGAVLGDLGRIDDAVAALKRALSLDPANADALRNLGVTLQDAGRHAEAESTYRQWTIAHPADPAAALALGRVLRARGRHGEARERIADAVRLAPALAEAQWDLALAHLTLGDFAAGWDAYRWRWALPANAGTRRPHRQPAWNGRSLAQDETLLLWGEQGVGDTLMFAACIADALSRTPRVVVEVESRLVPLLARSFPAATVVPALDPTHPATRAAGIAAQAPLGDLPAMFRRDESAFPCHAGWLVADRERTARLRDRYASLPGGRRIGLAWRSANPASGAARSLDAAALAPLALSRGIAWISLQYGATPDEIEALRDVGIDLHVDADIEPGSDLDGHAAQLAALDGVVTIENATAHFAGALGRPGLVLLPFGASAYWGAGRSDSPWYPSLRLLRQAAPGDWWPVAAAAASALDPA